MGQLAKKQTFRGADAAIRLYKNGAPLDIMEAEEIELNVILKVIESEPLSVGRTQRDTHTDGIEVTVKGVRKGNDLLNEILDQLDNNVATGKRFDTYTASITYTDRNTGLPKTVKVKDATITELDPFTSGKNFDKQGEGFKLIGQKA